MITLESPDGPAELEVDEADDPGTVLLLGHGAGGDITGWDLQLLAERLPALGVTVARFRQPYRVAGRKIYSSLPGLDRAWQVALAEVSRRWPDAALFTGGHSAGSRVACRGFGPGQRGLVLLSFPLHPPGRPEKSRVAELISAAAPTIVIQGTKDGFGAPGEVRAALDDAGRREVRVVELVGAGHSLGPTAGVSLAQCEDREHLLVWSVASFIETTLRG